MKLMKRIYVLIAILAAVTAGGILTTTPKKTVTATEGSGPVIEVRSGVPGFIQDCAGVDKPACSSVQAIREAYGFDLMHEVQATYRKMQKTAAAIGASTLTEDQYAACLKDKSCAPVPMLKPGQSEKTPEGEEVSAMFWHLADGKALNAVLCETMPVCDAGLKSGALSVVKGKIIAAPGRS